VHADDATALLDALNATPAVVVAPSINQPVLLIAATDSAPQLREPNEAMAAALPNAAARSSAAAI
jgi:hypothetical protein